MNKPRLACGHIAENPYLFEKMMVGVYSSEQLCYCIMLDAYLLDESFASEELAKWLGEECGLKELEELLMGDIRRKSGVEEYARHIMEYVGFYDREVIEETCKVIRDNSTLSLYEKNKARADYYLMCGRLRMALAAYDELLETIPEKEKIVRASNWHNCGYAYARMFQYEQASKAFFYSYKTLPQEDTLRQFLTALRMYRTDEEYLEYISGHPEFFEMSQRVEQAIHQAKGEFEGVDEYRMLIAMKVLREEGPSYTAGEAPYYSRLEEVTEEIKNSYREMVSG